MEEQQPWIKRIEEHFRRLGPKAFTERELTTNLKVNWTELQLPEDLSVHKLIEQLVKDSILTEENILPIPTSVNQSSEPYKPRRIYTYGEVSPYSIALGWRKNSYFSHASAIYLHGMTKEIPKSIYVNKEQSPKPSSGLTSQEAIDRAFASNPRISNYVYEYKGARITLLNGKHTENLGVTEIRQSNGDLYPITNLERTLIDAIVRPAYAGGIVNVRAAFAAAKSQISIDGLIATLQKLDYVYPYHQALGFMLESVGVPVADLLKLKTLGLDYDFYLMNEMEETEFNPSWRMYFPRGFLKE